MSWFNVWDGLKNKICRYLLQRYLGEFLDEKLNLEQLNVELYNGKAVIKNVSLKREALNELFSAQGWEVEVINGSIGKLTVIVPWNALMTNNSSIEVSDLHISLRPIKRQNTGTSMLESMWSSVSSSLQLAEECMKQNSDGSEDIFEVNPNAIAGLEKFAETIDNVLNRIKAKFTNTLLRLEYLSANGSIGIALITNIADLSYKNETGPNTGAKLENTAAVETSSDSNIGPMHNFSYLPTFARHNIVINGVRVFTEEFNVAESCHFKSRNVMSDMLSHEEYLEKRILMLEIKGQQQIKIKMKQSEEISGPKVSLDMELGCIYTFLTPRQIHLLLLFREAFYGNESNASFGSTHSEDAIANENLNDIPCNIYKMCGNLTEQSVFNEYEVPNQKQINLSSLKRTIISGQMSDSVCGSVSSNSTSIINRYQRKIPNMESNCEILHFNIQITSFVALVLHEDLLVECNTSMGTNNLNEKSQSDMNYAVNNFFNGLPENGCEENTEFVNLCEKNHICLRLRPICAVGVQQRNKSVLLLKFTTTVNKIDILEALDGERTPLINMKRCENSEALQIQPELILELNSTFSCDKNESTKNLVKIIVRECLLEIDISIYDRLSSVLGPSPFIIPFSICQSEATCVESTTNSFKMDIMSDVLDIKIRFPIVDLRAMNDPEHIPWWKKNIRIDFLLLNLIQFRLNFTSKNMDVTSNEVNIYYCEKNLDSKIHLLRSLQKKAESVSMESSIEYPRITVTFSSTSCSDSHKKSFLEESYPEEKFEFFNRTKRNLPFSSKYACRQSDTPHTMEEGIETILLPGETDEINDFCEAAMQNTNLLIKVKLPVVHVNFESKQLYEIIYNRLSSDLFMWEPSSPLFKNMAYNKVSRMSKNSRNMINSIFLSSAEYINSYEDVDRNSSKNIFKQKNLADAEVPNCESNEKSRTYCTNNTSDCTGSIYYSTHDQNNLTSYEPPEKSNNCSMEIFVGEGSLTLFVPVRDIHNDLVPLQHGKFEFRITNLNFFSVNGYNGNNNISYLCIEMENIAVYHCGHIPVNTSISMQASNSKMADYMQSTFYEVPHGLTKGKCAGSPKRKMVSLILELKKVPHQKIKRLKITSGIQKTAFRYHPCPSTLSWLNQLMDFLEIDDFPVEGYQPFGIITEIELHLWDCAIDYRPKTIPYRAVLEIGSFAINSNVISSVAGCNLRFIAEECVLSLAPFDNLNNASLDYEITSIESRDLVPVLDFGLLDISLRLNNQDTAKTPKFDIRCSMNDVHLRTCSDSGSALAKLIAHIANDGDISPLKSENVNMSSSRSSIDDDLNSVCSESFSQDSKISSQQQERVNMMMAEALRDTGLSSNSSSIEGVRPGGIGSNIFYFPDENDNNTKEAKIKTCDTEGRNEFNDMINFENNVMLNSYDFKFDEDALPQVKTDLGDFKPKLERNQERDDFCIITEDVKGLMNQYGANVELSNDPLRVVDNHFCVVTEKPDLLKAPVNFPMAELRYTLCEMTFTWHMYGGTDFEDCASNTEKESKKTSKPHMSEAYKHGVSYSKITQDVEFGRKPKEKLTWKSKGGPGRNHGVIVEVQFSKVRFSHEVYPNNMAHASRQVLLINEVEIRDRLQSSDINKFLYHPNLKAASNKNFQHAVVIKAFHIRPNQHNEAQECSLRISLQPMRLHIDQDTLLFLGDFFCNLNADYNSESFSAQIDSKAKSVSRHMQDPVMSVNEVSEAVSDLQARKLVSTNIDLLVNEETRHEVNTDTTNKHTEKNINLSAIYFREVIFSPDVSICFDYHGRRVEMSRGPIAGLLMGLGQLQCSEIRLQKLVYRRGLLGFEKLFRYLCKEWLKDIKRNQLPKILSGVGPTYAFVQFFQGIYDLFWLPIEQYQRDGRIIRGLQLGTQSFTARTALAALEITSRFIHILQLTAETAFDMVSAGPSIGRKYLEKSTRKRPQRPKDIREGVANAFMIVKEGINDSANTLIETAAIEHDQKGYTGAVGAVVRQIPQLVVCPAVLATQATTNILSGVKNSLVPDAKNEAREKWKDNNDYQNFK